MGSKLKKLNDINIKRMPTLIVLIFVGGVLLHVLAFFSFPEYLILVGQWLFIISIIVFLGRLFIIIPIIWIIEKLQKKVKANSENLLSSFPEIDFRTLELIHDRLLSQATRYSYNAFTYAILGVGIATLIYDYLEPVSNSIPKIPEIFNASICYSLFFLFVFLFLATQKIIQSIGHSIKIEYIEKRLGTAKTWNRIEYGLVGGLEDYKKNKGIWRFLVEIKEF